jgi:hypothetical protein
VHAYFSAAIATISASLRLSQRSIIVGNVCLFGELNIHKNLLLQETVCVIKFILKLKCSEDRLLLCIDFCILSGVEIQFSTWYTVLCSDFVVNF